MWETPSTIRPSCSTEWSSIDARRLAVLGLLAALGLAGCARSEAPPGGEGAPDGPASNGPAVELIRHGPEGAAAVPLSDACRDRLPGWAEELMAGAAPVRLLVTEERIRAVRENGALEVALGEVRVFPTAADADTRASRLLIPLDDPSYLGDDANPFVTVFRGDDEGFGSGPYQNPEGWTLLRELEACAEGG